MKHDLSAEDVQELKHLSDGGRWCLDGRKEKRLMRLGVIEPNSAGIGLKTSQAGRDALKRIEAQNE